MKIEINCKKRSKGQVFEILGFLILAVAVIGIILFMRIYLVGSYGKTFSTIVDRQVREGSDAGVKSILATTEDKSGKSILELIGIAAYIGDTNIDLGPGVGAFDLKKEIEWRFDAIYGKGHWYMSVPFPNITSNLQIVVVADTSASMCDDLKNIADNVPKMLTYLKSLGRKAEVTVYMLPGQSACVFNGVPMEIDCNMFNQSKDFQCRTMRSLDCTWLTTERADEDWGDGIVCAIRWGPVSGWDRFSTKIIIPISDELPGGSECGVDKGADCTLSLCPTQRIILDNAMIVAIANYIPIFPLKAYPCGYVCQPSTTPGDPPECADLSKDFGGYYCTCGNGLLKDWMNEIGTKTGGAMFELSDASDASKAISSIITLATKRKVQALEIGTKPPITEKNIRSINVMVPVSLAGVYTEATIKEWS
jgi:hypothetical protein